MNVPGKGDVLMKDEEDVVGGRKCGRNDARGECDGGEEGLMEWLLCRMVGVCAGRERGREGEVSEVREFLVREGGDGEGGEV